MSELGIWSTLITNLSSVDPLSPTKFEQVAQLAADGPDLVVVGALPSADAVALPSHVFAQAAPVVQRTPGIGVAWQATQCDQPSSSPPPSGAVRDPGACRPIWARIAPLGSCCRGNDDACEAI